MSDGRVRSLVDAYLRQVAEALEDIPSTQRHEILDDLRAHIDEALAASPEPGEAAARTILDRLGQPEDLAREARERLDMPERASKPIEARQPGTFETIAVVLTAICWPIGILLVWLSEFWRTRDKVVATLLPVLGVTLVLISLTPVAFLARAEYSSSSWSQPIDHVATPAAGQPGGSAVPSEPSGSTTGAGDILIPVLGMGLVFGGLFGMPLISAIYLAVQLRRPVTRRLVPAGAAGTG